MAGTITFSGLGTSGLDTSSWVEALVSVKQTTITSLQAEQQQKQQLLSVVNSIKSYFTSFQSCLQKLTDSKVTGSSIDLFMQNLAISSNSNIVTATATTEAARQTYDVLVEKLATATKASSGYTRTETLNATLDTTLGDLGAEAGTVTINQQSFSVSKNDTVKDLIKKFSDVGVIASFDENKSKFTIGYSTGEIDFGATNLQNALKLSDVTINGVSSGSIVYADRDTELYKLGLTGGAITIEGANHTIAQSGNNYTITKDGGAAVTMNTLGQFLDYLTGANVNAESATVDDKGNISIRGAVIAEVAGGSNLLDALNLRDVVERTVMHSNNLTYQQGHAIDFSNKLSDIGLTGNYDINGTSFNGDSTFEQIKTSLGTIGYDMTIDNNGVIMLKTTDVDNGLSGTLLDALGLTVSDVGTYLTTVEHTVTYQADGSTLLSTLGIDNTKTYTAYKSDGTAITGTINNNGDLTIDQFIAQLQAQGLTASFDETTHKIRIDDGYIEGDVATILGMGTETIYYQEAATADTTLETLGATANQTLVIDGVTKTYAKTDTLQKVMDDIIAAGGTVELRDGTMSVSHVTLTGTLAGMLGFEAISQGTAITSGALSVVTNTSSTSSGNLTETSYNEITLTSKIGDITGTTNNYTLTVNGSNTTLTKDSTLQAVSDAVTAKGGTFKINDDNTITIEGVTLGGNAVTALQLGVTLQGTDLTSTNPVTYGGNEKIITGSNTLEDLGATGNSTLKILNLAGTSVLNKTYTKTTTVDTILADINSKGMTAKLENGVITVESNNVARIDTASTVLGVLKLESSSTGMIVQSDTLKYTSQTASTSSAALTPTTTTAASLSSTLSNITGAATTTAYTLNINGTAKNYTGATTLSTIKSDIEAAGGTFSIDGNGKVTVESVTLTGTAANALSLTANDQRTEMTSTNAITVGQKFLIDENTTFGGTGTNALNVADASRSYALYDSYGNVIKATSTTSTSGSTNKISNWLSTINSEMNTYYGTTGKVYATVDNGIIKIDGGYVTGDLANAIGMTTTSSVSGKQLTGGVAQYTEESKFIGQVSNQIIPPDAVYVSSLSSFTSGATYYVSTAADLNKLSQLVNAGKSTSNVTFIMTNDIDMSAVTNFGMIGNGANANQTFKGTFLGNGYEIQNLTITNSGGQVGLFGYTVGATIKDLGLFNVNVSSTGTTENSGYAVGSLIGYANGTTVENCYASGGVVKTKVVEAGGLIGFAIGNSSIKKSFAAVNVVSQTKTSVGGFVAYLQGSSIEDSYASGSISGTVTRAGGFVGNTNATASISNSYATGDINITTSGPTPGTGGFIGNAAGNIQNCYATGKITGNSTVYSGGFAGNAATTASFVNCVYNQDTGIAAAVGGGGSSTGVQGWTHAAILADGNGMPKLIGNNPYVYREITKSTTMAEMGLTTPSNRELTIMVDGVSYSKTFAANETVQTVLDFLNDIDGVEAKFENSQLNIKALHSQNLEVGGKVATALLGENKTENAVYYTKNGDDKIYYDRGNIAMSSSTRIGDLLGTGEGGSLNILIDDTVQVTVSYEADDTVGEVLSDLALYGITANVDGTGKFTATSNDKVSIYGNVGQALLGASGVTNYINYGYESDELDATVTSALATTSTLESLGINSGSIQVVDSNGNFINNIDIDNTKTLGQLASQLSAYGFTLTVDTTNKKVTVSTADNRKLVDGTSNMVSGLKLDTWGPTEVNATETTTLKQLGFVDGGEINLTIDGQTHNLTFGANNTLRDVKDTLESFGLNTTFTSSKLSVSHFAKEFNLSGNLGAFLSATTIVNPGEDYTSEQLTFTTDVVNLNTDATIGELLNNDIGGTLRLTFNDSEIVDLTYAADDTVQDVLDDLANLGIEASISGTGVLTARCEDKTFIMSGNVGRAIQGDAAAYTDFDFGYKSEDLSFNLDNKANNNSTLKELGITSGQIYVLDRYDNVIDSITLDESMTIAETKSALAAYGFAMSIDGDGKVTISSNDGNKLADGSSNMVSGMKLDTWTQTTSKLTTGTSLAQMGFKDGADLNLLIDGSNPTTISFGANNTVQDIISSLAALGINASVNPTDGAFTATSTEHTFVFSGDLGKFLTKDTALGYVNTDKGYVTEEPLMYDVPIVTNTSKLLDYSHALTADDTVASMGFADGGVIRLILDGNTPYTLSFEGTDTMQDIVDTLATYGISTNIATDGIIEFTSHTDEFTMGGALGTYLAEQTSCDNNPTEYTSGPLGYETTEVITEDTKLSQLGVAEGSLNVVKDGNIVDTLDINNDTTIAQLFNAIKVHDMVGSIMTEATTGDTFIQLYSKGDTVLTDGTCDAVTKLGLHVVDQGDYDTHIEYWDTGVTSGLLTEDTLLTSLDKDADGDGNTDTAVGSLIFKLCAATDPEIANYEEKIINITAEDTIGTLIDKFESLGVHAVLDNGVLKIDNSVDGITFTGGSSKIFDTMGIADSAIDTYSTSNATLTYQDDITYSVANYADANTTLETVNVTDGQMSIYVDGVKCTVAVNGTDTFSALFSRISSTVAARTGVTVKAGFLDKNGNIVTNPSAADNTGIIGIEAVGDHELVVGASNDTTNFATIANLQQAADNRAEGVRALYKVNINSKITGSGLFKDGNVSAGTFTIGDAEFTIDANTTLNDLITQINKSDKSYATAYWDTLSGTLVLQSTHTGESLINIEKGTSNFTDVMGFTDGNTLVTDTQTLGSNAQVRINGTLVTSTSNTITSDISKIKGLTINLKNVSEGETVTITVEQDDEAIFNAVSDVIDSYNVLMEGLEKELGEGGAFEHNVMFKMMKNNLKNLMTKSLGGTLNYKNLSAIGISTGEAQDSITTDVTALMIDKDKFIQCLDENSDAVKQLLVGTDANQGVFWKANDIAFKTLMQTGYIASTEKTLNKEITKIGKKITSLTTALAHYREQLQAKFSTMERTISGLQTSYSGLLSM